MPEIAAVLSQLNLVVSDIDETVTFYRRLGLTIERHPAGQHATAHLAGLLIEWDTARGVRYWDSGWRGTTGGSTVLGFSVASRESVDRIYAELVGAGYAGHQSPYDAFWGARYAIVEDPDANCVGIMSPEDPTRSFWPPRTPPSQR